MTTEKIKSLLLMNENKKITVTLLAKKMNVSKATMSRMINTFYEQGLTLDKGMSAFKKRTRIYWKNSRKNKESNLLATRNKSPKWKRGSSRSYQTLYST